MTPPEAVEQISTSLDVNWIRAQFPSLQQSVNGKPAAFLDAPGGTQVPLRVMDAMRDYLLNYNANTAGAFTTSRRTDAMLVEAHAAMADLLGCDADEVAFGPNMSTMTLFLSRAIGRDLKPGDEIVVTNLDHDANVSPWKLLEERGAVIRTVDIRDADCTLDLDDLHSKLSNRTRLVAVGYASNAVGTINPVAEITRLAHARGALVFIDAVHYAPHGSIDVRALDCDFLACSPYKFFGPHSGVLYGKREHLKGLHAYKLRAATDQLPFRWEIGTQNHECLAGVIAAVDYIADVGRHVWPPAMRRREALKAAYNAIRQYERALAERLIRGLLAIPRLKLYGITDPARFAERVGTVAVRIEGYTPLQLVTRLGEQGIFTWDGNYYALNLTERLGVEASGGFLRIGLVHYNTAEEVDRVIEALRKIAAK